jgi:hypothetical protein
MDPVTLALIQGGSSVLSSALGGSKAGQPAQSGSSAYTSASFDNSGWTVATGQGKATSTPPLPWTWILVAGVVALLIWKRA